MARAQVQAQAIAGSVAGHVLVVGLIVLGGWCGGGAPRSERVAAGAPVELRQPARRRDVPVRMMSMHGAGRGQLEAGGTRAETGKAPPERAVTRRRRAQAPVPAGEPRSLTPTTTAVADGAVPVPAGRDAGHVAGNGHVAGTGAGTGSGIGDGVGRGVGNGEGAGDRTGRRIAAVRPVVPPSLARPARLIYPRRQGDAREGRMFLVLLTVDADGFVVGVKMKRGSGGRRGDKAADAVWRFRYDPARDARGRKIRSQVEQPFILLD